MKKRNKLGSHVGMIISFVIFITFIVFLYTVVKPAITTGEDKQTILSALEMQILENISANLTTATVQIKNNQDISIELQSFLLNMWLSQIPYYYNAIAQDGDGKIVNAYAGSLVLSGRRIVGRYMI